MFTHKGFVQHVRRTHSRFREIGTDPHHERMSRSGVYLRKEIFHLQHANRHARKCRIYIHEE